MLTDNNRAEIQIGHLFQCALHCNVDCTNHMEGIELYTLGVMDVVCQFFRVLDLSLRRGMEKYFL